MPEISPWQRGLPVSVEPWLSPDDRRHAGQISRAWRQRAWSLSDTTAQACCDAARHGDGARLSRMLEQQPHVDVKDRFGMTPLMHACFAGHSGLAQHLQAAGASWTVADRAGYTAQFWQTLKADTTALQSRVEPRPLQDELDAQLALIAQAGNAVRCRHLFALHASLAQLRLSEHHLAAPDEGRAFRFALAEIICAYKGLACFTLLAAKDNLEYVNVVGQFIGLRYMRPAQWHELLIALLNMPTITPAALSAAAYAGADLNARLEGSTLLDTLLARQTSLRTIEHVLAVAPPSESSPHSRYHTWSMLCAVPNADYIMQALAKLTRAGFALNRFIYEECNRDVCRVFTALLTPETLSLLVDAGFYVAGITRGGLTLAHHVAAGSMENVVPMLSALGAHGVDINAPDQEGCRPIAYLMRHADADVAAKMAALQTCGMDFEASTSSRLIANARANEDTITLVCSDALSLAAAYNHLHVLGFLITNHICASDARFVQAADVAERAGYPRLSIRLRGCVLGSVKAAV